MIKGIGIDIIELERIGDSIKKSERLAERVLTMKEMECYHNKGSDRRRVEYLAGRFASKEACSKALGTGIGALSFQDIEVLNDENGAPIIKVVGYEDYSIFLSISHSEAYAVAQVVIED